MSEEKSAIRKLYGTTKAKGFVNHLIQSYLPIYKISKVWKFKGTRKHKCACCSIELFDIEGAFKNLAANDEQLQKEFMPFLRKQIDGKEIKIEEHPFYKYVTKDKAQAFTGEKTDTYMCHKCIKELLEMVQMGILDHDKNIIWLAKKMQGETGHFDYSPAIDDEAKKELKIRKKIEKTKTTKTATFGDLEVLQKLKQKMEKDEN